MAPTFKLIRGVLCLAAFVVVSSSRADVVELKTGERLLGTFRQATSAGVVIEVGGESINMPLAKVRAIYFGPEPAETATQISLAGEALQALEALQSVTSSGVTYQEYARRVLDAKVKVDQYLKSPGQDDQRVRTAIGMAMRCYEVASQAWNQKIATRDPNAMLRDGAKLDSQIRCNGVVPFRQCVAVFKAEGEDQTRVWFETGRVLSAVEIGSHNQAGLGTGSANEVEHFFVAVQWLGSPVLGDL